MKKFFIVAAAMMALYTTNVNAVELDTNGRDPKYVETIMQRSKKVTDALNISGTLFQTE